MINPSPTAPLGSVTHVPTYTPADFSPSSAVLCRNSAPLITFAFALIAEGVGVRVLGREIGQGLIKIIRAAKTDDLKELEQKLIKMRNREVAKALEKNQDVGAIEDKYDCLNIFLQNADSVEALIRSIDKLFDDKSRGLLTLATIHKAKGLEWETVFILDFSLCPSKWAKQPWQRQQERNLQYVAVTRAKLHLRFISSGCWKKPTAEHESVAERESQFSDCSSLTQSLP